MNSVGPLSARIVESLAALYSVYTSGVDMDLRQVLLRYVANSSNTVHRLIYALVRYGYIRTDLDSEIMGSVGESLGRLRARGIRKGPYVGLAIASAVERVARGRGHVKWGLTEKGVEYLRRRLGELGLGLDYIEQHSALAAVHAVRRRVIASVQGGIRAGVLRRQMLGEAGTDVEASTGAARLFVAAALEALYPLEAGAVPKAGFALSFARDEDAAAEYLLNSTAGGKTLWKALNTEYVSPLVTGYRDYLLRYAVYALYPASRGDIEGFATRAANWPALARRGRAEPVQVYLENAIRGGHILDQGGVLQFSDPFLGGGLTHRRVLSHLNEVFFEYTVTATALLAFDRPRAARAPSPNVARALYAATAAALWQSVYSYPIPVVREGERVKAGEWAGELREAADEGRRKGIGLAFPGAVDRLDGSVARLVLEGYIGGFVGLLLRGGVLHTVGDPKGGHEVLVPPGAALKLFNVSRGRAGENRVAQLVYALRLVLAERGVAPLAREGRVREVLGEVLGARAGDALDRLKRYGVLVVVGGGYVVTPYELPAVYLDILKGPTSVVHAQGFAANLLGAVPHTRGAGLRQRLAEMLAELERSGGRGVPLGDFRDIMVSPAMDAVYYLRAWGAVEVDKSDGRDAVLRLSQEFSAEPYGAGFVVRALREALDWEALGSYMGYGEAVKELRDFAEGRDSHELYRAYAEHLDEVPEDPYGGAPGKRA